MRLARRPHPTREPENRIVGDGERFFLGVIGDDGQHGPEDFLLRDPHVVAHIHEYRGLDVVARGQMRRTAAAQQDARAFLLADADVVEHAFHLPAIHQRAHDLLLARGIAVGDEAEVLFEDFLDLGLTAAGDQQAGGDGATLAGVEAHAQRREQAFLQVGVGEHHVGGFAAQFQKHFLHGGRRHGHDVAAHLRGAGEGDHVHPRVTHQLLAHLARVRRGDDVEHARGYVGVLGHDAAELGGGPRRVGCRLQHDRAAGRERRRALGKIDLQRHVPGRDRAHYADRLLAHEAAAAHAEDRGLAEIALPRVGGQKTQQPVAEADGHIAVRSAGAADTHGRAGLGGDQWAKVVLCSVQRVAQLRETVQPESVVGGPVGLVEGAARGGDGGVHVGRAGVGYVADGLFGSGVDVRVEAPGLGRYQLAVNQQPVLCGG